MLRRQNGGTKPIVTTSATVIYSDLLLLTRRGGGYGARIVAGAEKSSRVLQALELSAANSIAMISSSSTIRAELAGGYECIILTRTGIWQGYVPKVYTVNYKKTVFWIHLSQFLSFCTIIRYFYLLYYHFGSSHTLSTFSFD